MANPYDKVKHDRNPLALIVRGNVKPEKFCLQVAKLSMYYDVDIYSFLPLPILGNRIFANITKKVMPPNTNVHDFLANIQKDKYKLAYLYLDDNSNSYTMQQNLKKFGIKVIGKTVIQEDVQEQPQQEPEENDKAADTTRRTFIL